MNKSKKDAIKETVYRIVELEAKAAPINTKDDSIFELLTDAQVNYLYHVWQTHKRDTLMDIGIVCTILEQREARR